MTSVLFLIDESTALEARVAEGTKRKAECYATALNALLNQLGSGPAIDIAVVGYRRGEDGGEDVECRWGGVLDGRQFVGTAELAAAPAAVENRLRKIPGPGGYGMTQDEVIRFPLWYVPALGGAGSRRAALEFCGGLLAARRAAVARPPLVIHLMADPGEDDLAAAVR
jgi:hypothetical protein